MDSNAPRSKIFCPSPIQLNTKVIFYPSFFFSECADSKLIIKRKEGATFEPRTSWSKADSANHQTTTTKVTISNLNLKIFILCTAQIITCKPFFVLIFPAFVATNSTIWGLLDHYHDMQLMLLRVEKYFIERKTKFN